ncbi:MAG: Fur family transcriptional regulator [Trueperaceae bacterium]
MQRNTNQRRAILNTLQRALGPLTPQEVLEKAQSEHERLGLATVYRNLNALSEQGDIIAVHLPNDVPRYEMAGRGHHHHFRCEKCGRVFELEGNCPVAVLEGVTLPGGFKVQGHELTLYGVCSACQS